MMHGAGKAYRAHVLHESHAPNRLVDLPAETGSLKRLPEQRNRCSLIYKVPILRMLGASARLADPQIPVETGTPPWAARWEPRV